ncbi:hypothetical protein [Oceaniglobus trochenteri]|uniref:hypothetical protein n=1 Tax=Oceaniglobus trochenteri TaxID=2763260 RepID=UPI001CFFE62F|nr:hypothetical protein [Oceaniglobus trochenteri]
MTFRLTCLAAALALALGSGVGAQGLRLSMPPDPESSAISVVTDRGLTRTTQLPTSALRAARRAMNRGARLDTATLRALADRGDGLAAWRLTKRLQAMGNDATPSDVAHYAAIAAGQGRVYALDDMIVAMRRLAPVGEPAARLDRLVRVLYAHAWAGNALALDAVIEFNGEGRLLGALSDATRDRIMAQAATMDGRVELGLALNLLARAAPTPDEVAQARRYLARAAQSRKLAVMTTAQNVIALLDARTAQATAAEN